jgi:hypothetical protein
MTSPGQADVQSCLCLYTRLRQTGWTLTLVWVGMGDILQTLLCCLQYPSQLPWVSDVAVALELRRVRQAICELLRLMTRVRLPELPLSLFRLCGLTSALISIALSLQTSLLMHQLSSLVRYLLYKLLT